MPERLWLASDYLASEPPSVPHASGRAAAATYRDPFFAAPSEVFDGASGTEEIRHAVVPSRAFSTSALDS
jgi:hypothetical protein